MNQIFVDGHGMCEVWSLPKVFPKKQRRSKYVQDSVSHPAKMNVGLCRRVIETYTKRGETVLDPMAGINTTGIEAAYMGRNSIAVELEDKFVDLSKQNIDLLKKAQTFTPKGKAVIIKGDSRELSRILWEKADAIVTSPPYHDNKSDWDRKSRAAKEGEEVTYSDEIGLKRENIGNIHYYDQGEPLSHKYSKVPRGKETYLSAMFQVYRECYKTLKPGGKMVLVLKDFIRGKKVVRLDLDTKKLVERCGFRWVETKLFKLPSKSFWRTLYEQKYPNVDTTLINYEFVEVFEKPLEAY